MKDKIKFKVIYLEENQGHGNARRIGLENCSYDLVALMDADDISLDNRFYFQLKAFSYDPSLDIVGGQITEFIDEPTNIIGRRVVPEKHDEIQKYMKKRCPMNQVSVMFKKQAVKDAGGYIDWYCEEDYYLWIRMFLNGSKFANVPENLVNVRVGNEMSARRGGIKYYKSEKRVQKFLLSSKIINVFRFLYNILIRFIGEVLLPNKIRVKVFRKMRSNLLIENDSKRIIEKINHRDFSVSMCVYDGDNALWFDQALESIINQSYEPSEVVLVVDGPINDTLNNVINKWKRVLNYAE